MRLAQALSPDEAESLLADEQLRRECLQNGVDLDSIVANLRLSASERLEATAEALHTLNLMNLFAELCRRRVRFVLIGGLAGRVYGSSYATSDLDICHSRDERNLRTLAAMLKRLKADYRRLPKFGPPVLDSKIFATETDFVFTTDLGKLDLIGEFTGVGMYDNAIEGAIQIDIGKYKVNVLSLPKLMAAKLSTGRPKDQLVYVELQMIERLRNRICKTCAAAGHDDLI